MAFVSEIIPFNIRTGTGTQTVNHILFPTVQAKAYIFASTSRVGTNSWASHSRGFDDGVTHVGTGMGAAETFGTNLTARGLSSEFSLITEQAQVSFGGAQMRFRGYVSAIGVGSFEITTDLNNTPGALWYAIMLGADDVSDDLQCAVGVHTSNAPGSEVVGFSPVAVLGLSVVVGTSETTGAAQHVGYATPCNSKQASFGVAAAWGTSDAKSYEVADIIDAVIASDTAPGATPGSQRTVSAWDATGFDIGGATVTTGDFRIGYLAIGGAAVAANLVAANQKTSTGAQNVTIDAVAPKLVLFGSANHTTATTVFVNANLSFGAFDGTSTLGMYFALTNGSVSPFSQDGDTSTTSCIIMRTATGHATSTLNAEASCTAITSGNVALNWSTADATAREFYMLVLAEGQNNGPCGANPFLSNSLTVTKIASPPTSELFTFTTTGGLSPSTFSLADGASRIYTGIADGTYGVTENPQAGWTPSYGVSSGDPHTAIIINASTQPTVTVTVNNTYRTTVQKLRRYRRFNLPWSENYNIFIRRAELIAQMGVGTSILDPTVTLRFSKDGGNTYPIVRTVTLGLQGDYTKRAYTLALGEARNWVCEAYCDDPVYCGWIAFDVDVDKGIS